MSSFSSEESCNNFPPEPVTPLCSSEYSWAAPPPALSMETRRIAQECSYLLIRRKKMALCSIKVKMYPWNSNPTQLVQKTTFTTTRAAPSLFYCCLGDGPPTDSEQRNKEKDSIFFAPGLTGPIKNEQREKVHLENMLNKSGKVEWKCYWPPTFQTKHDLICPLLTGRAMHQDSAHTLFGAHTHSN